MAGVYGQAVANATVGESDVVLVVGAKLSPQDTVGEHPSVFDPKRQTILQIDIDPHNAGWTFPVEMGLIGDAREILAQMIEESKEVLALDPVDTKTRTSELQHKKQAMGYYEDPAVRSTSSPVMPQRLVRTLQETLDPSTLVALDAGNNRVWMSHFYQAQQPKTFFCPGGTAGMGWSLPAALALKLAHPDRPVVGVTGDGGFMMSVHAISTALQYDLPVVWVVMNDSALGMVRHHQEGRFIASEFIETDHGAVARGMGAYGVQVKDPGELPDALRGAIASGRPAVVDVVIDRGPSIDDLRASGRRLTET